MYLSLLINRDEAVYHDVVVAEWKRCWSGWWLPCSLLLQSQGNSQEEEAKCRREWVLLQVHIFLLTPPLI